MIDLYMDLVELSFLMIGIQITLKKEKGIPQKELDDFREQWIALNESYRNNPNVVFVDNVNGC
jgi:hypothetical protein